MPIVIKTEEEIAIMREAGRHVAQVLRYGSLHLRPPRPRVYRPVRLNSSTHPRITDLPRAICSSVKKRFRSTRCTG